MTRRNETRPARIDKPALLDDSYRPVAVVEREGKLSLNVQAQGREAGLPAERPSGAVG